MSHSDVFILPAAVGAVAVTGLCLLSRYLASQKPQNHPLPPGPKRLPVVGNMFDMPPSEAWIHWSKYMTLYGPISSTSVFGQHFIVVNDQECARELLERRSAIYSERPDLPFINLCGWRANTPFLKTGDELLAHRKAMHQYIGSKTAIEQHYPTHELEARRFVRRLLDRPDDLYEQVSAWASAVILKVAYGYTIDMISPDPLVQLVEHSLSYLMSAARPGTWLMDVIPTLRYVPDWMPGAYFKRFAKESRYYATNLVDVPYQFIQHQMTQGVEIPSFATFFKEQNPDADVDWLKWSSMTLFVGGADTSFATAYAFFLTMVLNPDVQAKAQEEIDAVVGSDRLPNFSDRANLPYVEAVMKEVLRWHTVIPINPPHVSIEDDVYQGYVIPKGSMILVNLWQITHDPENYNDPFAFVPERFLKPDGKILDPRDVVFGYGRRGCAGKRFAEASLFVMISHCLATLRISKAVHENGGLIEPKYKVTDAMTSHPEHFHCAIAARSQKAKELIMSMDVPARESNNDADVLRSLL